MTGNTHTSRYDQPEFPGFVNVFESSGEAELIDEPGLDRRRFLALTSAALGMSVAAGCRRPDLKILPFSAVPDEQIGHLAPGKPTFYATCLPRPGGALPILVESHDGRPTKIEGNPLHPCSLGRTDAHAQAAIYDLYSPDRVLTDKSAAVSEKGQLRTWSDFDAFARREMAKFLKDDVKGKGFAILAEEMNSPSVRLLREHMKAVLPEAKWYTWEPIDRSNVYKGTELAFGKKLAVRYNLEKADRILALDSDFLGNDPDAIHHAKGFFAKRTHESMNRLYVVESNYTITGSMADHRLRISSDSIEDFLFSNRVKPIKKDLAAHRSKSVVIAGPRVTVQAQDRVHEINEAIGAIAAGAVEYRDPPLEANDPGIADLVKEMSEGKVATLLIIGGDPAFNAPADLDFPTALKKVQKSIRLGLYHDHTSEACDWHLPLAHSLESWGDAEAADGTLCCVQPLIAPLNSTPVVDSMSDVSTAPRGGRSVLDLLIGLTGFKGKAYDLVRQAFAARSGIAIGDAAFDPEFNRYKQRGYLPADKDKLIRKPVAGLILAKDVAELGKGQPLPTKDSLELHFVPSYSVHDGRFAMNPWLQELPDPITKLVWDNAAILSPQTAADHGLATGDVVKLSANGRSIEIPVFILPGHADHSITLPFGHFGEQRIGHVPDGGGTNVFPLRTSTNLHFVTGAKLEKTGSKADLVVTQEHGRIPEGRDIIREQFGLEVKPDPHRHELREGFQAGYGNPQPHRGPVREKQERFPLDIARPEILDSQFQWGMVIDLNSCTGCSACMIACQAENNIPVVGKHEVKRNRELHWIRIDRYFTGDETEPRIVTQPVACVQCEQAPCEQVCPVNAAVHSPEGLNLQVYNRCIGTRYCANACPYKVRRFNWFDFNKRHLDELRTPTPLAEGGASLEKSLTPETLKMQKNPDVTVRMRGVMEKCTYCVQRLERAKAGAKLAATKTAQDANSTYIKPKDPKAAGYDLDSQGRVIVPDGMVNTACAEACPSASITFGNVNDPASRVAKLKKLESEYLLLGDLNTKPRTSYLPRLRNPNPDLA